MNLKTNCTMHKIILIITAVLGALSVVFGAFGAHSLHSKLGAEALKNFETGVRYQMYHVLAIFLVATLSQLRDADKNQIGVLFLIGILFFSGSLYAITAGGINPKSIWFITPLGGLFMIAGWVWFAYKLIGL